MPGQSAGNRERERESARERREMGECACPAQYYKQRCTLETTHLLCVVWHAGAPSSSSSAAVCTPCAWNEVKCMVRKNSQHTCTVWQARSHDTSSRHTRRESRHITSEEPHHSRRGHIHAAYGHSYNCGMHQQAHRQAKLQELCVRDCVRDCKMLLATHILTTTLAGTTMEDGPATLIAAPPNR